MRKSLSSKNIHRQPWTHHPAQNNTGLCESARRMLKIHRGHRKPASLWVCSEQKRKQEFTQPAPVTQPVTLVPHTGDQHDLRLGGTMDAGCA